MPTQHELLAVPQTLEVEVEGEDAALEHAAEASLAPELPLTVDDLLKVKVKVRVGGACVRSREVGVDCFLCSTRDKQQK